MSAKSFFNRSLGTVLVAALTVFQGTPALGAVASGPLNISDTPLFLNDAVPPLNLLVLGRDHKLYYEAYNDASDLDGDGGLDVGYQGYIPAASGVGYKIDYFGYFDSYKCYDYDSGTGQFEPRSVTADKTCSGNWSGDFLNYITTARIDALRKVLYGGLRSTDTTSTTVLSRSRVPQDAHSWGKEYESVARDGYDISRYTPYALPTAGTRHLFANTTIIGTSNPLLRVLTDRPNRIWEWVAIERPVADLRVVTSGVNTAVTPTDFLVRVRVCEESMPEPNCQAYPNGDMKPTGLLQEYGQDDSMYFGLLTGSYDKNTSGGVLRRRVGSITSEIISTTGQLNATTNGILQTLNKLRVIGFGGSYTYNSNCGWITTRPIVQGECRMWGNPIAEMMYEGMRYFAGRAAPTAAFDTNTGDDVTLGLSHPSWDNPYSSKPSCSRPFETVISDINPSYDTDQLPGSNWGGISDDTGTNLNVSTHADTIWAAEMGGSSRHFIGESGGAYDGAPTAKDVSTFADIRGLAPEDPTKEGGYYSASVAYHGLVNDLNTVSRDQKLSTFAVALASPLPKIEIPVAGRLVTLVPFAKSVGGCLGVVGTQGLYQPTNTIVDFFVETITPTYGRFRVNFEDVEQGADHDMDAIVIYEYDVSGNDVRVTLTSEYAAGCIVQHMGYVISGTSGADGTYLEVRDVDTWGGDGVTNLIGNDVDYFLDTPDSGAAAAMSVATDGVALPIVASRVFTVGSQAGATLLNNPLWYAAKWGGFKDSDGDDTPNVQTEWDEDLDGTPDNYFLVTNALTLGEQLSKAFDEILSRVASASSASVNSGSISDETRVYQARFNAADWTGELISFPVNPDGSLQNQEWDAADQLPAHGSRVIITRDSSGNAVPFRWNDLDATRQGQLEPLSDGLGQRRLDYLRGDGSNEGTLFRARPTKLGDIVSSSPVFVGKPSFRYSDTLENDAYSDFRSDNENRDRIVYAGGNDGMLHGFDAETGAERLGFIPAAVFKNLHELTKINYSHHYYVDGSPTMGDAFFNNNWHTVIAGGLNKGGQGIYALDVTDPSTFSEANADSIVLWEFTDANDADLGYTYSRPVIVRMHNGKWMAVFGNGYNNTATDGAASATGNAALFLVDLEDGSPVYKIDTGIGMADDPEAASRPNGLATPFPADIDGDAIIDYIFAGDLFGNLWKFDVRDPAAGNWDVAYKSGTTPLPLFTARDDNGRAQPITTRPVVGRGPRGQGMIVLFGTGKYLEPADKELANLDTQSFYGIIDRNSGTTSDIVSGRVELTEQTIVSEATHDFQGVQTPLRVTSTNVIGNNDGWYIDLVSPANGFEGEMVVTDSILRNGRVIFATTIPSPDPCQYGGTSWLMEMEAITGERPDFTPFDRNGDGNFSNADYVTITLPDGSTVAVPINGLKFTDGITTRPAVLSSDRAEHLYSSTTGSTLDPTDPPLRETDHNPGAGAIGRQSWRQIK